MDIVIWGTGQEALELAALCDMEKVTITAFVDDAPNTGKTKFLGREVIAPQALPGRGFDALLIAPEHWQEAKALAVGQLAIPEDKIHAYHDKRFALLRRFAKPGLIPEEVSDYTIAALDAKPWYHAVEVFPSVFTPGHAKLQGFLLDQLPPEAYAGSQVLDIGAWTGPYTFEVERRGGLVTSYDIQNPEESGYNLLKSLKHSQARYVHDSVYNLAGHFQKEFDIILFFGVFYHLFNPMLALTNIHAALADDGVLLFEGAVLEFAHNIDPVWAKRKDRMGPYLEVPMAYFTSGDCLGHWSNWYVPNVLCLREWLLAAGFEVGDMYLLPGASRAYGLARKLPGSLPEHDR